MDYKTLEYLEARTKEARRIVNRIKELEKAQSMCVNIGRTIFNDKPGNSLFSFGCYNAEQDGSVLNKIRISMIEILSDEIQQLQKELREL